MAASPLKPHWVQPSHPDIQEVIINEAEFTSKSLSRVALPPWGLFARLDFPPCTLAREPTYATVQMSRDMHLNLNSDLLYINHSCEPSLIFDMTRLVVIAGPKGLQPGDELTFFYPSTEWTMAQPFDCLCGEKTCRGRISGAADMSDDQLRGMLLNKHIYELLDERKALEAAASRQASENGAAGGTEEENGLTKKVNGKGSANGSHHGAEKFPAQEASPGAVDGSLRRGPTSRELSGEMGGDTSVY
ncbi:hypothetical protein QBC47DRAFT_290108 [Echria macrotheca]|uniref:Post-SET domain-containing protein n=1 Tax=Echria macrotheca TaxID=438768 RepID=A0AAJ0FAI7_9PEZI|nr:hypothetical protein QBC47DRAFT_290108 [Echria macrotheca]